MSMPRVQPAYRLYQMAWAGLDWLYPPHCGGCDRPGSRWCSGCDQNTRLVGAPCCIYCGIGWTETGVCEQCRNKLPPFSALRSWAFYEGPIRNAIHRLKYLGDIALGETLARPLIERYYELAWDVNMVAPVPIGVARRAQRGYNQAALLAWPLALACELAYRPKALVKIRETHSQVGFTYSKRYENVIGAYQANPTLVSGKKVLVIDDVTTSGATMHACANALLSAGAKQVFGLTLARAGQSTNPGGLS
jgi:competence protein ComFC